MSKSVKGVFIALVAVIVISVACSGTPTCPPEGSSSCDPDLPAITTDTGYWVDLTGEVSEETMAKLEAESEAIEADGFQLAGFIAADAVSDPSEIASDFGNLNGIGSSDKDNGVVIVILLDKEGNDGNAPYIFIAPGSGLSYLTATKLGQVRDNIFKPARAEGEWERGLVEVVDVIHELMLNPNAAEYLDASASSSEAAMLPLWCVVLIIIAVVLFIILVGISGGMSSSNSSSTSIFSGGDGGGGGLGGGGGFSGGGTGG